MKLYRSSRVARYHPEWRDRTLPPLEPTFQVVSGYPSTCACPSRLAIVGENPGADEDQAGFPFVGRSGEELDRFLDTYGIDPDTTYITNIGKIFKVGNADPTEEDIAMWEGVLHEELNTAKPIWIAALGRISTRYFLGDVDMEAVHGIPFLVVLPWLDNGRGGRVVVVPIYHPAAGFHSTELQANIAYDFAQLSACIQGRLTPRDPDTADKFPNPTYIDLLDGTDSYATIAQALAGGSKAEPLAVAIDTEGLFGGTPWGLSFSTAPGTAFNIRRVNGTSLRVFFTHLLEGIRQGRIHVILHGSLHDLRVVRELGMSIPDGSFTDTMVLAYHLCIEPQGLKPLAFRHAGMEMESYEEQVSDAQDAIALAYYEKMREVCATEVEHIEYGDPELTPTGKLRLKGGMPVFKVLSRTVTGGFGQIEPYGYLFRNKDTGQLVEKLKRPKQIKFRVDRAFAELVEGKLDAAGLRKRWSDTDELIVDMVEAVIGPMREADLDDVPLERAVRYTCRDADATIRIYPVLKERHAAMGLGRVSVIDHGIIPMVDRMQEVGMPVDRDYFIWLSGDLARRMVEVQEQIKREFGIWMNPNSGDQVADILFRTEEEGGFGLIATKQTKGTVDKATGEVKKRRGSTQDKVLEGLRAEHPIIPLILDYRGLNKAKTSFADVVIRRAVLEGGSWIIHCNFRITRVSSGRLSATGPNLMAVVGGELGFEIRMGYIAGEGYEFAEWDLNQVEMRVMASEANDKFLISMFEADEDIHTGTADKMFKLNLPRPYNKKQVGKSKRDPAKRTGFGVITGIQAQGLVDQMRLQGIIVSEDEAAQWIVDWLAACPSVPVYMQTCHREAMAYGYVRDWSGRIRYLPGIHSPFRNVRAEAGRQSHSHKIQAGAQSIMKVGMATINNEVLPYWREKGKYIEPVLQVHDSLMLRRKMAEWTAAEHEELDAQVRASMFSAAPPGFRVPLDAGGGVSPTWAEMDH